MIEDIIKSINAICNYTNNNFDIYIKIKKILENINTTEFRMFIDSYKIVDSKIIYDHTNKCPLYTKYYLSTSELFDLVYIKWNVNSYSRIHDHPKKGCIVKILSGKLREEIYRKYYGTITFDSMYLLNYNSIGYKIGDRVLHKIIAEEESESLHVYIPGGYTPNNY